MKVVKAAHSLNRGDVMFIKTVCGLQQFFTGRKTKQSLKAKLYSCNNAQL